MQKVKLITTVQNAFGTQTDRGGYGTPLECCKQKESGFDNGRGEKLIGGLTYKLYYAGMLIAG